MAKAKPAPKAEPKAEPAPPQKTKCNVVAYHEGHTEPISNLLVEGAQSDLEAKEEFLRQLHLKPGMVLRVHWTDPPAKKPEDKKPEDKKPKPAPTE